MAVPEIFPTLGRYPGGIKSRKWNVTDLIMYTTSKAEKYLGIIVLAGVIVIIPLTVGTIYLSSLLRVDKNVMAEKSVASKCDLNSDGVIDDIDFRQASMSFGKVDDVLGNLAADLDGDGWVNSTDLEVIKNNSEACK